MTIVPQTTQDAGWDLTQVKASSWGLPPPLHTRLWWGARTINSRGERLGIVHDRQTGLCAEDGVSEDLKQRFERAILDQILPDLRQMQALVPDDRPYCHEWVDPSLGLIRAALRLSGGYGHLCVWLEGETNETE